MGGHVHIVFSMEELVRYVISREKLFDDYREQHQKPLQAAEFTNNHESG
jgi:hypothetical protein